MEITLRILCLLWGYLLGSFLTAECIARRLTGRSARDLGSGNPGMANIMATLGKGPGFAVLAGLRAVLAAGRPCAGAYSAAIRRGGGHLRPQLQPVA